jgi:MoxR-like ATPase
MEERQVTVDGHTLPLPSPFFVIATQNPIELEGTFPLPEAQLDRFLLKLALGYPERSEEVEILARFQTGDPLAEIAPVSSPEQLVELQRARRNIAVSDARRELHGIRPATPVVQSALRSTDAALSAAFAARSSKPVAETARQRSASFGSKDPTRFRATLAHCEVRQKYVRYHWYKVGETFCAASECSVTFTRACALPCSPDSSVPPRSAGRDVYTQKP